MSQTTRLYQINEGDLQALEEILPVLCFRAGELLNDTAVRMKFRRLKQIVSDVRWSYGPPSEVEIIPPEKPEAPDAR